MKTKQAVVLLMSVPLVVNSRDFGTLMKKERSRLFNSNSNLIGVDYWFLINWALITGLPAEKCLYEII